MSGKGAPLRVLNCLHSLEPGGVERDVLRFTKAWREHGIDARIALGRWEGRLQEEAPDIPYFDLGGLGTARYETAWMIRKLPAVIREFRPHVLFCASNGLAAVALAMRLRLGRDCPPIVLRVSNDLVRLDLPPVARRLHRLGLRVHGRSYAAVVAMAKPIEKEISEEMGTPPDRIVTINNASLGLADLNRLAEARDRTQRHHRGRHFLAVGRLMPQKNFRLLIEAFAAIARDHDQLTIVGEGAERAMLEERARALKIADRVYLPGHQIPVDAWFADADAFILSSDFEGVPAVIVEALAAAIPIVATNCTAALPMMIKGVGRLVPIQNREALARAMDGVCDDPQDVAAMRARASLFTTEATVGRWNELFCAVTAPRHD